jgi:hypothetical protein
VAFENSAKCLLGAATKQSDRPLAETLGMMNSPEDPRWAAEDPNSRGIFSKETATMYTETRKELEDILDQIQKSLSQVPVR